MSILEISYRVIQMMSEHAIDVEQQKNEELDLKKKEEERCIVCGEEGRYSGNSLCLQHWSDAEGE